MIDYTNLLVEDYYNWLLEKIDGGPYGVEDYSIVLDRLFNTEFKYYIDKDANRFSDGLDLRSEFCDFAHAHICYLELPESCSILEMMIALADRWDREIMYDPDIGDRTPEWFWLMFCNLGLDLFSDDCYDDEEVQIILQNFVLRRYRKDGGGGLFYTNNDQIDMRKLEIWYQINLFFNEHAELE